MSIIVKKDTLNVAVCSTVIDFNEGKLGICQVAREFGLEYVRFMVNLGTEADKSSFKGITRKSSEKDKKRRKNLRVLRRVFEYKEKESEGMYSYQSWGF